MPRHGTDLECDFRHAVDRGGRFVPPDRFGSRVAHGLEPGGAVAAHARQQDADTCGTGLLGNRRKEDIDRGAMARNRIADMKMTARIAASRNLQMRLSTRRQVDMTRHERRALIGFRDLRPA